MENETFYVTDSTAHDFKKEMSIAKRKSCNGACKLVHLLKTLGTRAEGSVE